MAKCVKLKQLNAFGDAFIVRRPDLLAQTLVDQGEGTFTTKGAWRAYEKRYREKLQRTSLQRSIDRDKARKKQRFMDRLIGKDSGK